jgi:hypothetical protein
MHARRIRGLDADLGIQREATPVLPLPHLCFIRRGRSQGYFADVSDVVEWRLLSYQVGEKVRGQQGCSPLVVYRAKLNVGVKSVELAGVQELG